jgi:hypothetical protein
LALLNSESTTTESQSTEGTAVAAAAASSSGSSAGQSLITQNRSGEGGGGEEEPGEPVAQASSPVLLTWARFVTGLDEALEKMRGEADERLIEEANPANEAPAASLLEEQVGSILPKVHGTTASAPRASLDESAQLDAVDEAIESLASDHVALPAPGAPVRESEAPTTEHDAVTDQPVRISVSLWVSTVTGIAMMAAKRSREKIQDDRKRGKARRSGDPVSSRNPRF